LPPGFGRAILWDSILRLSAISFPSSSDKPIHLAERLKVERVVLNALLKTDPRAARNFSPAEPHGPDLDPRGATP